ncbi:MAG: hypothetical protein K8R87_00385 [Verrucomicrobia bacterium]|nr:hypothetical protein [Verrucomicrobiota bacterium]
MRAIKSLLAGFALLAFTTFAEAQTTIRVTGSTAFRSATVNAIKNLYTANLTYGYIGASFTGAGKHIFKGDIGANTDVTIKTSWSGAVDGQLAVVSGDTTVKYLEDGGTVLSAALTNGGTANLTDNSAAAGVASDVAMLDHFQSTTPFKAPAYPSMTITPVGIIAFKWIANRGQSFSDMNVDTTGTDNIGTVADTASLSAGMTITGNANIPANARIGAITSGTTFTIVKNTDGATLNSTGAASGVSTRFVTACPISNMTPQIAQALYSNGSVSLATITGNSAHNTQLVWALGRDAGSGTRLQALQESGVGYNSQVTQFQPTISGGIATAQVLATNSVSVLPAIVAQHPNPGDGGYSSGGTLATSMTMITSNALDKDGLPHGAPTGPTAMGYFVSYAGISDATTAISGGAKELTWNGVPYSEAAVQEGKYTFWGYESLSYLTTLTGIKKTISDALANQIITVDAPSPKLSTMKCLRTADGGVVLQNY